MAVMTPYMTGRAGRRFRPVSLFLLLAYCLVTGVLVAILPPQLMFAVAIPPIAGIALILWLLPDGGHVPEKALATVLVSFATATVLWPSYLALDLPGVPWITPQRLVALSLLAIGLFAYSSSSKLRAEIADVLNTVPFLRTAFWIFWATTLITIPLSDQPAFSLNKWVNNQIYWTFLFIAAAWLGTRAGVIGRFLHVFVWATLLVALVTIYEYRIGRVPWADSIPSFLQVDANYLVNVLKQQTRTGTDIYRAHGPFTTSLVAAEYMAIAFPFLIHATVRAEGLWRKMLLIGVIAATAVAMWTTNARSATIGLLIAVMLYGTFWAFRYWRRKRSSLVAVSVLALVPLFAIALLVLSLTWGRLHNMTFGGAQHSPSSEARDIQWEMGTPMILRNPIGHGPARSGDTLGFANRGGQQTIDTYYLSLLLEYGVIGFAAFMAMFIGQAWIGLRVYLQAEEWEEMLAGPITIALVNFLIIKSVSSGEVFMPFAFIMLGFLIALVKRQATRMSADPRSVIAAHTPSRIMRGSALAAEAKLDHG